MSIRPSRNRDSKSQPITEAARQPLVVNTTRLPNVWESTWPVPGGQWTLSLSHPGDTTPRLSFLNHETEEWFGFGSVTEPLRFGTWGTTQQEFNDWCDRFRSACGGGITGE